MDLAQRVGAELFFGQAAARVVGEVASLLAPHGIPLMPLKGALLQKLVYAARGGHTRTVSDVDVLVPAARFRQAHAALRAGGFTRERWEGGGWQVAMAKPGLALGLDLHQRLSRTPRARLSAEAMFARARPDRAMFGVEVRIPSPYDLWAHLVLHGSLHWLNHGALHHAEDFVAVPEALGLDPATCVEELAKDGLVGHALVLFDALPSPRGPFVDELVARLGVHRGSQRKAALVAHLLRRHPPGSVLRRAAGLWAGDDWHRAFVAAARLRLSRKRP